jgi:hypothetical protein
MLSLCSPPSLDSILRKVREEEVARNCEGKGDYAVDDEEPAPYGLISTRY